MLGSVTAKDNINVKADTRIAGKPSVSRFKCVLDSTMIWRRLLVECSSPPFDSDQICLLTVGAVLKEQ